ncbi:putative TLC domain [Paratrimastix pyriformis]|uniref:TLC domain n=1 Tax=Paratrimastix pyriformis TaxID=342808 RepID=A0ABQ8UTV7_9EUKA|nr:putative TLC domain [Paratrimastix pyriformis]
MSVTILSPNIWLLVVLFSVGMTIIRMFYTKSMSSLYKWWRPHLAQRQILKAGESSWFTQFFATAFCLSSYIVLTQPWGFHPSQFVPDYEEKISPAQLIFIAYEFGFYISSLVYLFKESRNKYSDFYMMLGHHVAVLFLLVLSILYRYQRGCIFSLWLHDFADIFLEFSKLCHYLKFDHVAPYTFGCLVPAWGVNRIVVWPLTALRAFFKVDPAVAAGLPFYSFMRVFQSVIYVLDVAWFGMIMRMVVRSLKEGLTKDIRSDEDESLQRAPDKPQAQ